MLFIPTSYSSIIDKKILTTLQSQMLEPLTRMDPSKKLSTPQCPAEHRAWLLIYQKRIGGGKPLVQAFENQFSDHQYYHILNHAANVRNADEKVQSELLELAKQCSWYEEAPREGERNYKRMKKLEKQQEARDRIKARYSKTIENSTSRGAAASS